MDAYAQHSSIRFQYMIKHSKYPSLLRMLLVCVCILSAGATIHVNGILLYRDDDSVNESIYIFLMITIK